MTLHKPFKIAFGLLVLFAVIIGLTSINHPIVLKWVTGSAKHHGKPIPATVYTNGQVNDHFKLFYTDEPNNYLLSSTESDNSGILQFINLDLNEKQISKPVATSKNDYDFIAGHLFQSEAGEHFTPFRNDTKGINFDPHLTFTGQQITFNVPPNNLGIDSVRIILP